MVKIDAPAKTEPAKSEPMVKIDVPQGDAAAPKKATPNQ
jgi:hypothetical protein